MGEHTFGQEGTPRETLTVPEVARVLGISRNSAYNAVRRGELPALRVGGRIVVSRPRLNALLAGAEPVGSPHPVNPNELEHQ